MVTNGCYNKQSMDSNALQDLGCPKYVTMSSIMIPVNITWEMNKPPVNKHYKGDISGLIQT
jgi:hypothetical protein